MRARFQKASLSGESLSGIRIFRGLDANERLRVARYCEGRKYPRGSEIVAHGDSNRDVFVIISGRVNATVMSPSGKRITFQTLGPGDSFGELAWIDNTARSTSVVASRSTFVARISTMGFGEILKSYPSVGIAVMTRLAELVRHLCGRVYDFHTLDVKNRIRRELRRIAEKEGRFVTSNSVTIAPPPTHAEIASMVGTIRESVTRVLGELSRRHVVERESGRLMVRDFEALVENEESGADTLYGFRLPPSRAAATIDCSRAD